jgi:predicted GIY-YIG superfamily endonuclease
VRTKQTNNFVSQYLENISRKSLEQHPHIIKKYVNRRHGIYALYKKNKLYYVGLASNLRNRLRHHLKNRHANNWDTFSVYLIIGEKHLHELEALLLRIIDKKGNKQKGKLWKAEDLKKQLKHDLRLELNQFFGKDSSRNKKEPRKSIHKEKGRTPVLSNYIHKRFHVNFRYKGKLYIAHVRRNGTITFASESADIKRLKNKVFTSPSVAAEAITNRAMNGWTAWKYERAPGDWVFLDELRKK